MRRPVLARHWQLPLPHPTWHQLYHSWRGGNYKSQYHPSLAQRAAGGAGSGAQGSGRLFRVRPRLAAVRAAVACATASGCALLHAGWLWSSQCCTASCSDGPTVQCAGLQFQSAGGGHLQASALPLLLCRSVHTFAEAFKALGVPLHVLALNAGTFLWPYRK